MNYIVKRSKKRRKTIEIKIVDGQIIIYAPQRVSDIEIEKLYQKHEKYLTNRVENYNKNKDFVYFLGNKYSMIIRESGLLKRPFCEINGDKFTIYKPPQKDLNLKEVVDDWGKREIEKIIPERVKFFVTNYDFKFSFQKNTIRFKNQRTKWGSCSYCNNLNFNYKLIEKRMEIIDYLVVHELSHTIHKNHSKDFWKCVEDVLPNYRELRKELRK